LIRREYIGNWAEIFIVGVCETEYERGEAQTTGGEIEKNMR
jgi:hypothetical protein